MTAKKFKDKLDHIEQEKLSPQAMEAEFKKCLEHEILSVELQEEYNHFKCLMHSKAANFFYIRHFLLRLTYSSYIRQRIVNPKLHPHSILRSVLSYFIDYGYFHYVAYPFIEGHHLFLSENESRKNDIHILYSQRIEKARDFLRDFPEMASNKESSYQNIGNLVDRNFCLLLRLQRDVFENLEFNRLINKKYVKLCKPSYLMYIMFMRLIMRPLLWIDIGRVMISKMKLIFPHILPRLMPNGAISRNSHKLPCIMSHDITIDPMGFTYKKQLVGGQEKSYPSDLHSGLALLLWHILSRCAVIACLTAMNVAEEDIYFYYKKLRIFNQKWREKSANVEFELSLLDNEIIYRVTEQFRKDSASSLGEKIPFLEKIAMDIFQKKREANIFSFQNEGSAHEALGCAYMHI